MVRRQLHRVLDRDGWPDRVRRRRVVLGQRGRLVARARQGPDRVRHVGGRPGACRGGRLVQHPHHRHPAGAAVSGTKAAATAASTTGRAAALLSKGARIVDFLDPVSLVIKGGQFALPKLGDLLTGMRGATEGLESALRIPDVPTNLDLPTNTLDDLADELPPVRDPDIEVPTVREPVEVPVPANQLVGPDGTPIHDGGTNSTSGGSDGPVGGTGSTGGESGTTPDGGTPPAGTTLLDKAEQQWPTHTLLELDSGAKGNWTTELHTPAPNSVYVVDGDKIYVTDHAGRVEHVEGQWQPTSKADADLRRNEYQQGVAGRGDRLPTDVGGHWIAASGGGPGEGINLTAMDRVINGSGGAYGRMEAQVRAIVEANPSTRVDLRIDIEYPLGSGRPDFVSVDVYVDGVKTSTVEFDQ